MKFKSFFWIGLSVLFLLSGCSLSEKNPTEETKPIQTEYPSSETVSSEPEESVQLPGDTPPEDGMMRSRLTNEWVRADVAKTRPIAVIIPNEAHAVPHYNLSQASILYEAKVEGSMSRLMGIFEDWAKLQKIGNVRSLRSYFAYWALEWDAIIVHHGGPYFIYDLLSQDDIENIDGMNENDSSAFYRTADRDAPHNLYTSGPKLLYSINQEQYSLTYRDLTEENHFQFAPSDEPNLLIQYSSAEDAAYIDMTASFPLTRCYFKYNEADGNYYRYQYLSGGVDGPHMDEATGEQLKFSNVLVQRIKQEDIGKGYLAMQCHDTTKDGWFFTKGKGIHVTWEKVGDYGATKFYDASGKEILLNTGKTMILVIRDTDNFTYR